MLPVSCFHVSSVMGTDFPPLTELKEIDLSENPTWVIRAVVDYEFRSCTNVLVVDRLESIYIFRPELDPYPRV